MKKSPYYKCNAVSAEELKNQGAKFANNDETKIDWTFYIKTAIVIGLFIFFNLSLSLKAIKYNIHIIIAILLASLIIVIILFSTSIIRDEGFKGKGKSKGKNNGKKKNKSKVDKSKDDKSKDDKSKDAKTPQGKEPMSAPTVKKSNFSPQTMILLPIIGLGIIATIGNVVWKNSN